MMPDDCVGIMLLPLVFNLVVIFLAWVYYANRQSWSDAPNEQGRIYRCQSCGQVYVEGRNRPLLRCPRCGKMNEAVRR